MIFSLYRRSNSDSSAIYIYDGRGGGDPLHILEKMHYKPVILIKVHVGTFSRWNQSRKTPNSATVAEFNNYELASNRKYSHRFLYFI